MKINLHAGGDVKNAIHVINALCNCVNKMYLLNEIFYVFSVISPWRVFNAARSHSVFTAILSATNLGYER